MIRRLAAADPSLAQVTQGHYVLVDLVALAGGPSLQASLFADVVAGHRIGNGLAERGSKHAQDLKTRLIRGDDGSLVLTGTKGYATGSLTASVLGISALDEDDEVMMVFVGADDPGVHMDEEWYAMGQRATVSGGIVLDAVPVRPDHVLAFGEVLAAPQLIGARAQLVHAAIEVGIARAALDDMARFLRERARPFFEPVKAGLFEHAYEDPYALHRVGRLRTKVRAAEALLASAAAELEALGLDPADDEAAARDRWRWRRSRRSPARSRSRRAASCSRSAAPARPTGASAWIATGATPAPTASTTRSTGSTTTSAPTPSTVGCRPATASSDQTRCVGTLVGLDHHWRNARTHSVHDPIDFQYHHLGAHAVDGRLPPSHGQL